MSNEIVAHNQEQLLAIKHSLYPDATLESISMVLEYCKAAGVDVMSKAVHIVPMGGKDVIVPGIGLYRIKASRSGEYVGTDSPVFGPEITEKLGQMTITYPLWCEVTVKRLVAGQVAIFTAREFWKENYGSGRDGTPNMIWAKRPFGQISKTAESQALRKAFPELVSHQMVYEESHNALATMEHLTDAEIAVKNATNKIKTELIENKSTLLGQVSRIIIEQNINHEEIARWTHKAGVDSINDLSVAQLRAIVHKYEDVK